MMKNRFGVPVFYDKDKLIKHVTQNKSMDWSYRDNSLYTRAWQNLDGEDLWIEDITKVLSDTQQTHLANFKEDRYRVIEQKPYNAEGRLQETFEELEDAENYVEENYDIDI